MLKDCFSGVVGLVVFLVAMGASSSMARSVDLRMPEYDSYPEFDPVQASSATGSQLVSIEDITDFLSEDSDNPLRNMLVREVIARMEEKGVFLIDAGLLYATHMSGGKHHCGSSKHSWNAYLELILKNESNITLFYEALAEPIYFSVFVDGEIGISANGTLRPSTKIIGKCVRYDKIKLDFDLPNVPLEATVEIRIDLNPALLFPGENASGGYEIVVNPTGIVKAQIDKLGNIDPEVDVDAYGGIGFIVGSIFGSPVGGLLAEIGLAKVAEDLLQDMADTVADRLVESVNKPVTRDITSRLGGPQVFRLPAPLLLDLALLNRMAGEVSALKVAAPEVKQEASRFVGEALMYLNPPEESLLRKQKQYADGVLTTLIVSSLL